MTTIKELEKKLAVMNKTPELFPNEIKELSAKIAQFKRKTDGLSPWETVLLARDQGRPTFKDYAENMFDDFLELHGDRRFSDDLAMCGGFARLNGEKVMLIGHDKGRTIEERGDRNFGMPLPDGYRKAARLMRLAERFNVPIVTLIDTAGAYPGREAEERGQAEAIARNLVEMSEITVPIISIVVGEGGSGGALGIGVGNTVMILSNAVYSVISPEGCAGILWRDGAKANLAAEQLKPIPTKLLELNVVDRIIDEPGEGAHTDHEATFENMKKAILEELKKLKKLSPAKLIKKRFDKFSNMGMYNE